MRALLWTLLIGRFWRVAVVLVAVLATAWALDATGGVPFVGLMIATIGWLVWRTPPPATDGAVSPRPDSRIWAEDWLGLSTRNVPTSRRSTRSGLAKRPSPSSAILSLTP